MLALILLNVIAVILGSVESLASRWDTLFDVFETFSVGVFTLEYITRLWSCTADHSYSHPVRGRLRLALRPMSMIDLAAILPFYLPFVGMDLRSLRVLRLLRIVRIAKIGRYYSSLTLIRNVVKSRTEELVLTFALMGLLLVLSSSLLYWCENEAQPALFSSIPATMWWSITTLTTVGYGDMSPVTGLGKLCAGGIAVLGIGMFALPTAILGSGFLEALQSTKAANCCPHCGQALH